MPASDRKWALITGASSGGLGEAHAIAFLKRSINVVATSLDASKEVEHISSKDGFLVRLHLDVTSPKSIAEAVKQVELLTDGKLHFLMNNAGYGYYAPILNVNIEQAKKQYDVNFWGALAMTQAFFPMLRAGKGIVVNQSSISGLNGFSRPFISIYSSSKAALLTLSNTMRVELAPFDIRVVTLVTSAVNTEFGRNVAGRSVAESSPYALIKQEVQEAMDSSASKPGGHDRFQVAESTIDELLKEIPPLFIRQGRTCILLCIVLWLLPTWIWDFLASRGTGLDRLKQVNTGGADNTKTD